MSRSARDDWLDTGKAFQHKRPYQSQYQERQSI